LLDLDESLRGRLDDYLKNPTLIPEEFRSWLIRFIESSDMQVPSSSVVGFDPQRLPIGAGFLWFTNTAPKYCILLQGQTVSRTTYAALFNLWGTTYGAGDGSTTFGVPDLRQRFPLGKAASGTGSTLGGTGGAIDHSHTVNAHSHTVNNHAHNLIAHDHSFSQSKEYVDQNLDATIKQVVTNVNFVAQALTTDGAAPGTDSQSPGTSTSNPPFFVVNFAVRAV